MVSHRQPGVEEEDGKWEEEGDRKGQEEEGGTGGEEVDRSLLEVVEGGSGNDHVLHQRLDLRQKPFCQERTNNLSLNLNP